MNLSQKRIIKLVWIFFAIFLFHLVVFSERTDAATYECDSVTSCNTAIQNAAAGDTVQMNQSINYDQNGTAMNFNVSNITFSCGGFSLIGPNNSNQSNYGFYITNSNNVLKNCNVSGFNYQVHIYNSSNNLISNTIVGGGNIGFYLSYSSNDTLSNLTALNSQNGIKFSYGSNNRFTNIVSNNNSNGFSLSYLSDSRFLNVSLNSNINFGLLLTNSNSTSISYLTSISGINANQYYQGVYLVNSENISLNDSIINLGPYTGFALNGISNSTFTNLTLDSNFEGMYLVSVKNSSFSGSKVINSSVNDYGIYVDSGSIGNTFYDNLFNNSANYYASSSLSNYFNTTLHAGTNIARGPLVGGNFWAHPNGTGFSDTCIDANKDGICDLNYTLSDSVSVDYLPLSDQFPKSYTCDTVSSCNAAIQNAAAGDTVLLNTSLTGILTTGITLNVSNITFDCQENLINGSSGSSAYGINFGNSVSANYSTIQNCKFSNLQRGINIYSGGVGNSLFNITSILNAYGVYLGGLNLIANNLTFSNNSYGFYCNSCNNGTFTNIVSENNSYSGIFLAGGGNNLVENATSRNNPLVSEIYLSLAEHDDMFRNIIANAGLSATFHVSQLVNSRWEEIHYHHFKTKYSTNSFNVSPRGGEIKLRISQEGLPFADADQIKLNSCLGTVKPEYARYVDNNKSVLNEISSIDNNVTDAHNRIIEISWKIPLFCLPWTKNTVSITANEYGSALPFRYPLQGYLNYSSLGNGSINLDGKITSEDNYSKPSYKVYWKPSTGHPNGYTYIYTKEDSQNFYFGLDVTPDNTNDTEDWAKILINTSQGEKEFEINHSLDRWGRCSFGMTDKVNYTHSMCEFVIPKTEINSSDFNFAIQYYGTAAAGPVQAATGIYISGGAYNNTFYNITSIGNSNQGIAVVSNFAHNYNHFSWLNLSGNGYGMYFYSMSDNTVNNSYISNSTNYGIRLESTSDNNTFYNNVFNNSVNYYNATANLTNYFNTTKTLGTNIVGGPYIGGNYWDNYSAPGTLVSETCTDADSDGICDSQYNLSDGINLDYLPLTSYVDTVSPTVSISYPVSGGSYSSGTVTILNYTATDNVAVANCWYSLDNGITNSTLDSSCGNFTGLTAAYGSNTWMVYANDTSGNVGSAGVIFSIGTTTTTSGGGGGGGGTVPGGGSTTSTTTVSGISTTAGVPYTVNFNTPSVDLTSLSITTNQSVIGGSVSVSPIKSVPQADLQISGSGFTYQSFQITTTVFNDSIVTGVNFGFKVNKTWISDNNFLTSQISLYRNTGNNKWTELNTTLVSNDSQYYYFTGFSPGFSNYTIFARVPECNFGDLRCHDSNLELCNSQSSWEVSQECQYGCSNLACQDNPAPPTPKNLVQNVIDNFKQNKGNYIYYLFLALILAGAGVYIYFFYRYLRQIYPQNKIWKSNQGEQ